MGTAAGSSPAAESELAEMSLDLGLPQARVNVHYNVAALFASRDGALMTSGLSFNLVSRLCGAITSEPRAQTARVQAPASESSAFIGGPLTVSTDGTPQRWAPPHGAQHWAPLSGAHPRLAALATETAAIIGNMMRRSRPALAAIGTSMML